MKKLLSIAIVAGMITACNDNSAPKDATASPDTSSMQPAPAPADTSSAMNSSTTIKDGLMTMKDGKMMIAKGGAWEEMKEAVTCTNGRKVSPDGDVSKSGKKRKLTEGMMIDKDGQMMDKDGKMLDNTGWE